MVSVTSERTFSALRQLKNYMKQDSLKKIDSGTLDTMKFTRRFDGATNNAKGIFENLSRS